VYDVIFNETDLAGALRARAISRTRIDVLKNKPPDDDQPLHVDNLPNLLVSPHNAWGPVESRQHLTNKIAIPIRDYKSGAPRNSSLPA